MDTAYWNDKAGVYEDEIFNVWDDDRDGVLSSFFENGNFRAHTVMDCGCGIGHGIATLSKNFKTVHAVDISRECLTVAQERFASLPNVTFYAQDLSNPQGNLPIVDCAVSVNAVITPSITTRLKMLKVIRGRLKPDGKMVLVVPSLESYYYASYKMTEWRLRDGERVNPRVNQQGFERGHGILPIDGVLTKHYLEEELLTFLRLAGFKVADIQKIKYNWDTEFVDPPKWMQEPYPWDWMCVAERR